MQNEKKRVEYIIFCTRHDSLEHLLPDIIPQLILVQMGAPGVICQVVRYKIVNSLSQILVCRLQDIKSKKREDIKPL